MTQPEVISPPVGLVRQTLGNALVFTEPINSRTSEVGPDGVLEITYNADSSRASESLQST